MHAKAHIIVFPDGTWCLLAGAQLVLVPDIDVLTHGDSIESLVKHGVIHIIEEWGAADGDDADEAW